MPKPCGEKGEKNLVSVRLKELREKSGLSQRALAGRLQLKGIDMDKNVITRIETNKRYITDIELRAIVSIFDVSYDFLIEGIENGKK
jgi:transcriptional regulator with XRE-family HTH domain